MDNMNSKDVANIGISRSQNIQSKAKLGGVFTLECIGSMGQLKWKWTSKNMVFNGGLQHIVDVVFLSGAQKTSWYVGLMAASPTVSAGNTLGTHTGWTEFTSYTGSRKLYSGTRSSQTMSNNSTKASFGINASGTVGGAFICSTSTNTSGVLMCGVSATEGNRSVVSGDTINARYDFTAADDGV